MSNTEVRAVVEGARSDAAIGRLSKRERMLLHALDEALRVAGAMLGAATGLSEEDRETFRSTIAELGGDR